MSVKLIQAHCAQLCCAAQSSPCASVLQRKCQFAPAAPAAPAGCPLHLHLAPAQCPPVHPPLLLLLLLLLLQLLLQVHPCLLAA
jgi:hypothetical protein